MVKSLEVASKTLLRWGFNYGLPVSAATVIAATFVLDRWPHLVSAIPEGVYQFWGLAFLLSGIYLGFQAARNFRAWRKARKQGR